MQDSFTLTFLSVKVTFDPLLLRAQDSIMFSNKTLAWLARAGGDIIEMDNHDKEIGYDSNTRRMYDCESSNRISEDDEAIRIRNDRLLMASAPSKVRRLALSEQEMLSLSRSVTDNVQHHQTIHGLDVTFPEKSLLTPGLLPDGVLNNWDQLSTSTKYKCLRQVSSRYAPSRHPSKQLKFRLVIDPPEGEKLVAWRGLQTRMDEQADLNGQLLIPPPRTDKKKQRQALKNSIRLRS